MDDAGVFYTAELDDNALEAWSIIVLDTLTARIEGELELIFPDANIISVECDRAKTPVVFRMTIWGAEHCPEISPDRIKKVADVLGPDIAIDVDYGTPVSNGFVLVATPRIMSDADDEC